MCPSICGFTYDLNMIVLHQITVMKCVNSCPSIILDAWLVADVKLKFFGLHAHLTWIFSIFFCGEIYKPSSLPGQSLLEGKCAIEFIICKRNKKISPKFSNACQVVFVQNWAYFVKKYNWRAY
jgi:hypothetical protein